MRKMYVDNGGEHCFMLIGYDVYYTNWKSDVIKKLDIKAEDGN